MSETFASRLGLLRSILIYNKKPFVHRRLRAFYGPMVQADDLCFDIGAHVGNRTRAWLALGARVVAVEPQPICYRYLERHFGSNPHFTLEKSALGAQSGEAPLFVAPLAPTVSSLSASWVDTINATNSYPLQWETQGEVQVQTLQDLIDTHGIPTFCKIDVEGMELDVLVGLQTPLPALSFEFYPTTMHLAHSCVERLMQLGEYTFNWSIRESLKMASSSNVTDIEMKRWVNAYDKQASGDIYAFLTP